MVRSGETERETERERQIVMDGWMDGWMGIPLSTGSPTLGLISKNHLCSVSLGRSTRVRESGTSLNADSPPFPPSLRPSLGRRLASSEQVGRADRADRADRTNRQAQASTWDGGVCGGGTSWEKVRRKERRKVRTYVRTQGSQADRESRNLTARLTRETKNERRETRSRGRGGGRWCRRAGSGRAGVCRWKGRIHPAEWVE
jgi:hypothetical protein